MDPIISPWLLYVVSVLSKVNIISIVLAILSFFLIFPLIYFSVGYDNSEEMKDKAKKMLKLDVVIFAVTFLMAILVPTKPTMIQMIGLSLVTPDNIQGLQENLVESIRQIAQAIK